MDFFETIGGRISLFLTLLAVICGLTYFYFMDNTNKEINTNNVVAVFQTNLGNFEIELFNGKAPKTVENFKKLVQEGFYNGVKFHRIIKDFMIQTGDPLTKDDFAEGSWGTGGPGYMFEDEICELNKNDEFTISMANAGPNTNGSQFFINTANNNFLDTKHTVFGKVVSGIEVIEKIENTEVKADASGNMSLPVEPVVIEKIELK